MQKFAGVLQAECRAELRHGKQSGPDVQGQEGGLLMSSSSVVQANLHIFGIGHIISSLHAFPSSESYFRNNDTFYH